jgi:hypothetical protein
VEKALLPLIKKKLLRLASSSNSRSQIRTQTIVEVRLDTTKKTMTSTRMRMVATPMARESVASNSDQLH